MVTKWFTVIGERFFDELNDKVDDMVCGTDDWNDYFCNHRITPVLLDARLLRVR